MAFAILALSVAAGLLFEEESAATGTVWTETLGGQHPNQHMSGFRLNSVIALVTERGSGLVHSVHRRKLRFDNNQHLLDPQFTARENRARVARGLSTLADFAATTSSRDRVLSLMKMCVAAYPGHLDSGASARCGTAACPDEPIDRGWSEEVLSEILENNEQLYTTDPNPTKALDDQAVHDFHTLIAAEVGLLETTYLYGPVQSAKYSIGVAALEWVRDDVTVLAFRGTYTEWSETNMQNLMMHYVLEKMSAKLKKMWKDIAQLEWTDEMEERYNGKWGKAYKVTNSLLLTANKLAGSAKNLLNLNSFAKTLVEEIGEDASLENYTLREQDMAEHGYWPLTKIMVDKVVAGLPTGQQFIITGHSQGGSRAQLASMYLKKKTGTAYPTVTFAATGVACSARLLYSNKDYLEDVDPYVEHPQITDYVHPLDPWGMALGEDAGGTQCYWGMSNLSSSPEAKYCARFQGYSGPQLLIGTGSSKAQSVGVTGFSSSVLNDFKRCRYFTHDAEASLLALQSPGALTDAGYTDGGCVAQPVIPEDDPDELCPTGEQSSTYTAIIIGCSVGGAVFLCCLIGLCIFCCCKFCKKGRAKVDA